MHARNPRRMNVPQKRDWQRVGVASGHEQLGKVAATESDVAGQSGNQVRREKHSASREGCKVLVKALAASEPNLSQTVLQRLALRVDEKSQNVIIAVTLTGADFDTGDEFNP